MGGRGLIRTILVIKEGADPSYDSYDLTSGLETVCVVPTKYPCTNEKSCKHHCLSQTLAERYANEDAFLPIHNDVGALGGPDKGA
jgi:hypothetical protein